MPKVLSVLSSPGGKMKPDTNEYSFRIAQHLLVGTGLRHRSKVWELACLHI